MLTDFLEPPRERAEAIIRECYPDAAERFTPAEREELLQDVTTALELFDICEAQAILEQHTKEGVSLDA